MRNATELDDYLFDLRGYLILENALDTDLLNELNTAFDHFPELEREQWWGNVQRLDNNGASGTELQNIVEGGPAFEKLIDNPSWINLVRRYCGDQDSYTQGVFIDECFASIRRSGGFFPVHSGGYQGSTRGAYRYRDGVFRCGQVNILMALTDVGPNDGGTMVIPGSHKSQFPHPRKPDYSSPMDTMEGAIEVQLKKGDALLFVDGISHGASSRTNPGERRVVIYRYGVSWGSTRYGYRYSPEFLARLTPERRKIMEPIPTRKPEALVSSPPPKNNGGY